MKKRKFQQSKVIWARIKDMNRPLLSFCERSGKPQSKEFRGHRRQRMRCRQILVSNKAAIV